MKLQWLEDNKQSIAEHAVGLYDSRYSNSDERPGPDKDKLLEDTLSHLDYLKISVASGQPNLFADYVQWVGSRLEEQESSLASLKENVELLGLAAHEFAHDSTQAVLSDCIQAAIDRLECEHDYPSFLPEDEPFASLASGYLEALLRGDRRTAVTLIENAISEEMSVRDIYLQVFEPCQHEIGRLWQLKRISVAQEHFCTAATQFVMSTLYQYIFAGERRGQTVVGACVSGDLHEIGLRMVMDFLEMNGWDSIYLGANTPPEGIVSILKSSEARLLAISATITPHVARVAELIALVRKDEKLCDLPVIVGGYPFNLDKKLWATVGANAVATTAAEAVIKASELLA